MIHSAKSTLGLALMVSLLACGSTQSEENSQTEGTDATPVSQSTAVQEEPISIFGTVKNPIEGAPIVLKQFKNNQVTDQVTLELDANGHFAHTVALSEPSVFELNVQNVQRVLLVLHDEDIEITVDGQDPAVPAVTEGSFDTDYLERIFQLNGQMKQREAELNQQFLEARQAGDQGKMNQLMQEAQQMQAKLSNDLVALLKERGPSLAAIQAMSGIDEKGNMEFLVSFSKQMREVIPGDPMVQNWAGRIATLSKTMVGATAPDLKYATPEGGQLALSELRGQYVLIDFWASWCKPCRAENPNVVAAYNAYKDKGFTVLGVSLDQDGAKWRKAIETDGLTWNHISDLGGWQSQAAAQYAINAIPANYLVDPEGKIIATELRGAALHRKLEEVLGQQGG